MIHRLNRHNTFGMNPHSRNPLRILFTSKEFIFESGEVGGEDFLQTDYESESTRQEHCPNLETKHWF